MNREFNLNRRSFLGGALAVGACGALPSGLFAEESRPLKFLVMTDHHVESDWIQSHGAERGQPVYTCWKPGDHAALTETYRFINSDPYCRDASLALFCGDQINTGYDYLKDDMAAEMVRYHRTLESLDLHAKTLGRTADLNFTAAPWSCRQNLGKGGKPYEVTPPPPASRVIAIQGNHDTGVREFYRDCAFTAGDVRFITFFAAYVGLPAPRPGVYVSTAKIADQTIAFIEKEMAAAAADPSIRHIVLASHWAIADKGENFVCPIIGACKENGMSANRDRLLALCEKYGCDLFINGHEHNGRYPVGKVGNLHDINCGTPVSAPLPAGHPNEKSRGAFAMVEIHPDKALFHVYSRAAVREADGKVVLDMPPRRLFTREIPLRPIR